LYGKFLPDGTADNACEAAVNGIPAATVSSSYWTMNPAQGPTLSLDLYNPILHYFCQPASSDIDGMAGDYEFIVLKTVQDTIYLKGKKNSNRLTLWRVKNDEDPIDYLKETKVFADAGTLYKTFDLNLNGNAIGTATLTATGLTNRTITIVYNNGGADISKKVSFVFTPTGIKLYEPFTFNGVTIESLTWDDDAIRYTCPDPGVNVELVYTGSLLFGLELTNLQAGVTSVNGTFTSSLHQTVAIIEQGVIYATTNSGLTVDGTATIKPLTATTSGSYPFELTGLGIATSYYARAYVRTSSEVFYSSTVSFSTVVTYEEYLGNYTLRYSTATGTTTPNKSISVSLVQGTQPNTYFLKGILADESVGNIVVNYNPSTSSLSFTGNIIGVTSQGYNFHWAPYSRGTGVGGTTNGSYYVSPTNYTLGMVSYDYDAGTGSFKTKYNGTSESYVSIGFILRNYVMSSGTYTNMGNVPSKDGQHFYFYLTFTRP
jgi:hypothetical protein